MLHTTHTVSLRDEQIPGLLDRLCTTSPELNSALRLILSAGLRALQTETLPDISFREATEARLAAAAHRRPSTQSDLRSYTRRMLEARLFNERPLRSITPADCRRLLEQSFGSSPSAYRKAYTTLHSIFSYGLRKGWCGSNPTDALDLPPLTEERIEPLGLRQVGALIRACRSSELRPMDAPLRLMLWCGVRPGEVQRLRWGDIDSAERCVYIEPRVSKTGGARAIPLRGGALALLEEHHAADEYVAPRNWQRLWRRLRERARLHRWQQDTLRHTFASMHLKHFHNLSRLQEEMGHRDSNLLRTRYLNLRSISASAAGRFFAMSGC